MGISHMGKWLWWLGLGEKIGLGEIKLYRYRIM